MCLVMFSGGLGDKYYVFGAQKTIFKFSFFSCILTKNAKLVINDFTIDQIILEWFRRQNCRQKGKIMKKGRSERKKLCMKVF